MTTAALTPQERQALNAWIAEHVYELKWETTNAGIQRFGPIPDYTGDWSAAGPLFDRYEMLLYKRDDGVYIYRNLDDLDYDVYIARGTTGPEAIAKAVKVWEEGKG